MTTFEVKKAKRQRRPLKINLEGLSGSGKTFTALRLAFAMRRAGIGKRIVVADSENESAGLYDGITQDGERWEYEVCQIPAEMQNPDGYTACYRYLTEQGYDIIIMDSLTHAWHGAMQQVDDYSQKNRGDKFGGWASVTPAQRNMLATLTDSKAHLISTMRVKSEYERVPGSNGKDKIKKVGMKTDQRDGAEYEFDVVCRMDTEEHAIHVEKVRGCTSIDGKAGKCPGPEFWKPLFDWWLSAPEAPSPESLLKAATTVDELAAAWMGLTSEQRKSASLATVKDARKAEIQKAGEHRSDPPSPEPSKPATPAQTPSTAQTKTSSEKASPEDELNKQRAVVEKLVSKVAGHEDCPEPEVFELVCNMHNAPLFMDLSINELLSIETELKRRLKEPKAATAVAS